MTTVLIMLPARWGRFWNLVSWESHHHSRQLLQLGSPHNEKAELWEVGPSPRVTAGKSV